MARYDIENFLSDLVATCKAKLNTKIADINAEKGDAITVATVPDEAYFFQALNKAKAAPYPVFMFYGLEDPETDGLGPYTSESYEIYFIVVVKDTAENEIYLTKLLRYARALKEIFEQNFSKNPWGIKLKVSSLSPVGFEALGMPGSFKACGAKIRATLG